MSQADPGAFVDTEGGTAHVSRHNSVAAAFLTGHSGTARPSYAVEGTIWRDSDTPSATVQTLFYYDGAADIGLMQIDKTNDCIAKIGIGIVPSGMASGTLLHLKTSASGATAPTDADELVIDAAAAMGATFLGSDAGGAKLVLGSASDNDAAQLAWLHSALTFSVGTSIASGLLLFKTGAAVEAGRFSGLNFFLGDTTDVKVTQGSVRNQGASDDFIESDKSSDIATGYTSNAETANWYAKSKQAAASGGTSILSLSESTAGRTNYSVSALGCNPYTSMSAANEGVVSLYVENHARREKRDRRRHGGGAGSRRRGGGHVGVGG